MERFGADDGHENEDQDDGCPNSSDGGVDESFTDPSTFAWWRELNDAPEIDDTDDIEATAPLPLPPDDRLWRHPSELSFEEPERQTHQVGRLVVGVAAIAGLLGAMIGGSAVAFLSDTRGEVTERVVERELAQPVTRFASAPPPALDVVAIADAVRPSMVRVESRGPGDSLIGSGSGVIFRDDGHILTNAHVISAASSVWVVTHDGVELESTVIGIDVLTDIAVVRVDSGDRTLVPAVLGSTADLRVGAPAVAIGSPLRLEGGPTVTVGVVSALGRSLDTSEGRLYDLVQTDAPISPGSSGGALLDADGALIGITTIIAVSDVGAEGLGFATPIEIAYDVAADLLTNGAARHGFLGISGDDVTPAGDDSSMSTGALVTAVGENTPAEQAGLETGDIITTVDGEPVESMAALVVTIRRADPDTTIELGIIRDGRRLSLSVRLTDRPD